MATTMFTALQKYATFSGRARRKEYWLFFLFTILAGVVASLLDRMLGLRNFSGNGPFGVIESLAFVIPSLSVYARRLHDVNKTGWLMLLPLLGIVALVPAIMVASRARDGSGILSGLGTFGIVGGLILLGTSIYLFVLLVTDGTPGTNRFGPDPKQRDLQDVFA